MKYADPRHGSFVSANLKLHFVEWGETDRPKVILIHGVRDHCRTWDRIAKSLSEKFHVIAPDLRGHGDSDLALGHNYRYTDYIFDTFNLVVALGLEKFSLVGHSMGGAIANLFAGIYREHVDSVAAIEGIGIWKNPDTPQKISERIKFWAKTVHDLDGKKKRRYTTIGEAAERMASENPGIPSDLVRHLSEHGCMKNTDGTFSWKYHQGVRNFSLVGLSEGEIKDIWADIRCPILLLNADNGLPFRCGQNGTLRYFQGAQLETIVGAGHLAHHEQVDQTLKHLEDFLTSNVLNQENLSQRLNLR